MRKKAEGTRHESLQDDTGTRRNGETETEGRLQIVDVRLQIEELSNCGI